MARRVLFYYSQQSIMAAAAARRFWVGGNWKMNLTQEGIGKLLQAYNGYAIKAPVGQSVPLHRQETGEDHRGQ